MTPNYSDPTRITFAVQKNGRLADASLLLLERCGLHLARSRDGLFAYGESMPVDLLFVRDDDIPSLVADGHADFGIVGRNVADEYALGAVAFEPAFAGKGGDAGYPAMNGAHAGNAPETADGRYATDEINGDDDAHDTRVSTAAPFSIRAGLSFGACRLSIAVPESVAYHDASSLANKRIATSYPNITRRFLRANNVDADVVKLSGSVELAPRLGSADAIADIVATGRTLRAHNLREVDVVMTSTAVVLQSNTALDDPLAEVADRLFLRIDSTLRVDESKYVMLHAPVASVDRIAELLPGAERPTILPLAGCSDRVALHAVCGEAVLWEHLESLKSAGASAIIVLPVERMLL